MGNPINPQECRETNKKNTNISNFNLKFTFKSSKFRRSFRNNLFLLYTGEHNNNFINK